jgi:hypothetical protein
MLRKVRDYQGATSSVIRNSYVTVGGSASSIARHIPCTAEGPKRGISGAGSVVPGDPVGNRWIIVDLTPKLGFRLRPGLHSTGDAAQPEGVVCQGLSLAPGSLYSASFRRRRLPSGSPSSFSSRANCFVTFGLALKALNLTSWTIPAAGGQSRFF